jgi:hypothetical protein
MEKPMKIGVEYVSIGPSPAVAGFGTGWWKPTRVLVTGEREDAWLVKGVGQVLPANVILKGNEHFWLEVVA